MGEILSLSELGIPEDFMDELFEGVGCIDDKILYIRTEILPAMAERRGREVEVDRPEITAKLYGIDSKYGERLELMLAWLSEDVVEVALEIADNIYYALQAEGFHHIEGLRSSWIEFYGVSTSEAYDLCIIKYRTRLGYGDREDHKDVETAVMSKYLDANPEMFRRLQERLPKGWGWKYKDGLEHDLRQRK